MSDGPVSGGAVGARAVDDGAVSDKKSIPVIKMTEMSETSLFGLNSLDMSKVNGIDYIQIITGSTLRRRKLEFEFETNRKVIDPG